MGIEGEGQGGARFRRLAERCTGEAQPMTFDVEHNAIRLALPLHALDNSRERIVAALALPKAQVVRAHTKQAICALRQAMWVGRREHRLAKAHFSEAAANGLD